MNGALGLTARPRLGIDYAKPTQTRPCAGCIRVDRLIADRRIDELEPVNERSCERNMINILITLEYGPDS